MRYQTPWMRTTRKYNPDHMDLDDGIFLPWKYAILSENVEYGDEEIVITMRVKLNDSIKQSDVRKGLRDEFMKGCSCEHDCCGHLFGGLNKVERPHNRKKNEWILKIGYMPNY